MLNYVGDTVQTCCCLCQTESSGPLQFNHTRQTGERVLGSFAV